MLTKPLIAVCLLVATIAVTNQNTAHAQLRGILEDIGREYGVPIPKSNPRRNDPEPPDDDNEYRSKSIPSESGKESGGGNFRRDPGWGQPRPGRRTSPPPRRSQPSPQPEWRETYQPPIQSTVQPVAPATKITISCPKTESETCSYELIAGERSYSYTLKPGYRQTMTTRTAWRIRYQSGAGIKIYRLRGDSDYFFRTNEQGHWQIYRKRAQTEDEKPPMPQPY